MRGRIDAYFDSSICRCTSAPCFISSTLLNVHSPISISAGMLSPSSSLQSWSFCLFTMSGSSCSNFTLSLACGCVGVSRCAALIYSIHGGFECSFLCTLFYCSFQRTPFRRDIFENAHARFCSTFRCLHGDAFHDGCGATYDGHGDAKQCLEQTAQSVTALKRLTAKYPHASSVLTRCSTLRLSSSRSCRSRFSHDA